MIKTLTYTTLLFLLLGCGLCKDDELELPQQSYYGTEMRVDGYYYAQNTVNDQAEYAVFVFFQNGTFYFRFSDSLEQVENEMINGTFVSDSEIKLAKLSWGRYNVNSSLLITESWKLQQCGYPSVQLSGSILNDSTLNIGSLNFKDNNELTYTFREFSPKPDSTNVFV